jgi:hypothetical protein
LISEFYVLYSSRLQSVAAGGAGGRHRGGGHLHLRSSAHHERHGGRRCDAGRQPGSVPRPPAVPQDDRAGRPHGFSGPRQWRSGARWHVGASRQSDRQRGSAAPADAKRAQAPAPSPRGATATGSVGGADCEQLSASERFGGVRTGARQRPHPFHSALGVWTLATAARACIDPPRTLGHRYIERLQR